MMKREFVALLVLLLCAGCKSQAERDAEKAISDAADLSKDVAEILGDAKPLSAQLAEARSLLEAGLPAGMSPGLEKLAKAFPALEAAVKKGTLDADEIGTLWDTASRANFDGNVTSDEVDLFLERATASSAN